MFLNHGLAVVEVYLDLAGVEQVILNGNGSVYKGESGNAKANGKDNNGDDAACQSLNSFAYYIYWITISDVM